MRRRRRRSCFLLARRARKQFTEPAETFHVCIMLQFMRCVAQSQVETRARDKRMEIYAGNAAAAAFFSSCFHTDPELCHMFRMIAQNGALERMIHMIREWKRASIDEVFAAYRQQIDSR